MANTSIDVLTSKKGSQEPLLSFKWVCKSLPYGLDPSYVEEVDLPFVKLDVNDGLFGAGTFTYYPGFSDIDSITLTLYEDSSLSTHKWIQYWYKRIKNFNTGTYFLPSHYKETIKLEMQDTTGASIFEVSLTGVWPDVLSNWTLQYTDSERMRVVQSFSVDDQELKFLN